MKEPEIFDDAATEITTVTALEALNRSEIDISIATAHRFPRSIAKFKQDALSMATLDEETASSCFYVLKRQDSNGNAKNIEGPSIRLAEIVGSAWGNMRYGARVISIDDKFVTAQGVCHDLEKNNSANVEVRRRITTKSGKRYGDDMIGVTANAACAIALRNAIFKVVPFTYAKDIFDKAKQVAIGDVKTLSTRRQAMMEHFKKMGVSETEVLAAVDKKAIDDIDIDTLATLKGFATAIKDGDSSVDDTFRPKKDETAGDNLKNKIEQAKTESAGKQPPLTEMPKAATTAPATTKPAHPQPATTPATQQPLQAQTASTATNRTKMDELRNKMKPKATPVHSEEELKKLRRDIEEALLATGSDEKGMDAILEQCSKKADDPNTWMAMEHVVTCTDYDWLKLTLAKILDKYPMREPGSNETF